MTDRGAERRLSALTDFAKALSAARWSDDVLTLVATEAMRALDADSLSLSAWERESGWLRTLVNVGDLGPHEESRPTTELYPISIHGDVWEHYEQGEGVVIGLGSDVTAPGPLQDLLLETGKASALAVPVLVDGRLWGDLWAARAPGRRPFTPLDLDFAGAVAVQVAAGVGQAEHLAAVERLAYTDPLTGLANRRVMEDHLDVAMARHASEGVPVTLVVADLNELKTINDLSGHHAGDQALRSIGHLLSATAGELPGAVAARIGGDEFCLLAVDLPTEDVIEAAGRLSVASRRVSPAGLSIGIASTDHLNDRVDSGFALFRIADAAQYRAKRTRQAAPVVAGRTPPVPLEEPAPLPRPPRRRWRDKTLGADQVLAGAARVLALLPEAAPRERLAAVAAQICEQADGSSWWMSRLPAGSGRFFTVDSGVTRLPTSYRDDFRLFFDAADGYAVEDYPMSLAAVDGAEVVVEADDPDADPSESALLAVGGFTEMVLAGGYDATGDGWLVEIFADEISVPVRDYALALRAAVAMAIVGASVRSG